MKSIHVTVFGPPGSGKTHFIETVLLPALDKSGRQFDINDGGTVRHVRTGKTPAISVLVTNDPYKAAQHAAPGPRSR